MYKKIKDMKQIKNLGQMFFLSLCVVSIMLISLNGQETVPSDLAFNKLKEGNSRFSEGKSTHSNISSEVRKETSDKGQHPYATIISCSDSRVPVEYIFDAGIGELFVVRVAGNVVDTDEIGSIEYGIGHLHTPILIVLGHTKCGAVTAVVNNASLSGSIPKLVDNISPAVAKAKQKVKTHNHESHNMVDVAIEMNVWQSIEDLLKNSHEAVELVKQRKLKILGGIYNLESGKVEWLGEHPKQESLLSGTHH